MELSGVELTLTNQSDRERKLRKSLAYYTPNHDYILLDCPPNLGLVTLNALVASTHVLVPLQTEFYALEGLSHILKTIERIRKLYNKELQLFWRCLNNVRQAKQVILTSRRRCTPALKRESI